MRSIDPSSRLIRSIDKSLSGCRATLLINKITDTEYNNFLFGIILNQTKEVNEYLKTNTNNYSLLADITPLVTAIVFSRYDMVRALLDFGFDPNITNEGGANPLHFSSNMILSDITELLLNYGANPLCFDSKGNTPLIEACQKGYSSNINLLMNKDTLNICNKRGDNALNEAITYNYPRVEVIVEKLLKEGVNILGSESSNAFIPAIQNKNYTVLKLLNKYKSKRDLRISGIKISEFALHLKSTDSQMLSYLHQHKL